MNDKKMEAIMNSMFDRLGLPHSGDNATLQDATKIIVLQELINLSSKALVLLTPTEYLEIMRTLADAIELSGKI